MNRRDFLRSCTKYGAAISMVAVLLYNLGEGEPLEVENCMAFDKPLSEKEAMLLTYTVQFQGEWVHIVVVYDRDGLVVAQYKNGKLQSQIRESLEVGDHTISVWTRAA